MFRHTTTHHVGVFVNDLDAAMKELGALWELTWCDPLEFDSELVRPDGSTEQTRIRFAFSLEGPPHLELVDASSPGFFRPPPGEGRNSYLSYFVDDVSAEMARLAELGCPSEGYTRGPDGTPVISFHRSADAPRLHLVSSALRPSIDEAMKNTDRQAS